MIMRLSIVFATLSPFLQAATAVPITHVSITSSLLFPEGSVPVSTTVLAPERVAGSGTLSTPIFEDAGSVNPSLTYFSQSGTLSSSIVDSTPSGVTSTSFLSDISSTHPPNITRDDNDNDNRGRNPSTNPLSKSTYGNGTSVISCHTNSSIIPHPGSTAISKTASGVVHYGLSSPTDGTAHPAFTHDNAATSFVPHTMGGPTAVTFTVTHFSCPTPAFTNDTTTITTTDPRSTFCSVTSNSASIANDTSMGIPNPSSIVTPTPSPSTAASSVASSPTGGAISSVPYRSDIVSYFLNDTGVITAVPFGLHEFSQVGIVED